MSTNISIEYSNFTHNFHTAKQYKAKIYICQSKLALEHKKVSDLEKRKEYVLNYFVMKKYYHLINRSKHFLKHEIYLIKKSVQFMTI